MNTHGAAVPWARGGSWICALRASPPRGRHKVERHPDTGRSPNAEAHPGNTRVLFLPGGPPPTRPSFVTLKHVSCIVGTGHPPNLRRDGTAGAQTHGDAPARVRLASQPVGPTCGTWACGPASLSLSLSGRVVRQRHGHPDRQLASLQRVPRGTHHPAQPARVDARRKPKSHAAGCPGGSVAGQRSL